MTKALVLYSGGLDSILASKILMAQGIEVLALRFTSPFFQARPDEVASAQSKYGVYLRIVDFSEDFVRLLQAPAHGFGRNFNPCIDCKILMLRKARAMLAEEGANFVATGEVLGQRPMSQRRDALRVIERDSGCEGLLLRPLCALHLPPTQAEEAGLVDRARLYGLSGRGRTEQARLAEELGVKDYPSPAGGCLLTDVNITSRMRRLTPAIFARNELCDQVAALRLLLLGRVFAPSLGLFFVLGRDQQDNERILAQKTAADWLVQASERPGPVGLLRVVKKEALTACPEAKLKAQLAGLVLRYSKKVNGRITGGLVRITYNGQTETARFEALGDEETQALIV